MKHPYEEAALYRRWRAAIASVPAADEVHDLGEIFRPALERLAHVLVARRLMADLARNRTPTIDRIGLAEW